MVLSQDERCVGALVAALAPLAGPEARRLVTARSRPAVLLHGPATLEGGDLVEAAAQRVRNSLLFRDLRAALVRSACFFAIGAAVFCRFFGSALYLLRVYVGRTRAGLYLTSSPQSVRYLSQTIEPLEALADAFLTNLSHV